MNAYEKAKMLTPAIRQLYVNEGRSKSYISKLLKIDRGNIRKIIEEEGYIQINQEKRKSVDFLKSNKEYIIARIKDGWNQKQIYTSLKVGRIFYLKVLEYDSDIKETMRSRPNNPCAKYEHIDGEIWKDILGYSNYQVSNFGRIRNTLGVLTPQENIKNGYMYIALTANGKRKNFRIHRLVAHNFCNGYSNEKNQVNHIDGDITNNKASNLEWVSPSENLIHSYEYLNRKHKGGYPISYIICYQNKYQFKTISSFARFLNISETQAKRYIENKEKHNITLIKKH